MRGERIRKPDWNLNISWCTPLHYSDTSFAFLTFHTWRSLYQHAWLFVLIVCHSRIPNITAEFHLWLLLQIRWQMCRSYWCISYWDDEEPQEGPCRLWWTVLRKPEGTPSIHMDTILEADAEVRTEKDIHVILFDVIWRNTGGTHTSSSSSFWWWRWNVKV